MPAILRRLGRGCGKANGGSDINCTLPGALTNLTRGFANQEEMPGVCLVNYNARLYDPALGRFLAPDPTVESPYDLQDLNRYSYVGNNPLSVADPSGLCFMGCFWHSSLFKAAANIVIAWALTEVGLPGAESALGITDEIDDAQMFNIILGAGVAGYVTTGKLSGALASGAQAGFFHATGDFLQGDTSPILGSQTADTFVLHGLVGGLTSGGGGKFASGFLAAGVGSLADGFGDDRRKLRRLRLSTSPNTPSSAAPAPSSAAESSPKGRRPRRSGICSTDAGTTDVGQLAQSVVCYWTETSSVIIRWHVLTVTQQRAFFITLLLTIASWAFLPIKD